jgi:hypothetical protein
MFTGTEFRLDVGFNAAEAKLADLARGGLLGRVSGGAYDERRAGLARAGSQGTMLGMSRLARVRVGDNDDPWGIGHLGSAAGSRRPPRPLGPCTGRHIKLTAAGEGATVIAVSGICQPPLTRLAAGLDPAVVHQVAQATVHGFTSYIATDIADPVSASSSPGRGTKGPTGRPGPRH